jgi:hypothetical protein
MTSSIGMMTFPIIIWKNKIHVPNQQPGFGMIWIWRDLRIPIFR